MIERSRTAAAQVGAVNVEFYLAQINQLPLPDPSVDCVINLAPDKARVFREILRVLKPDGRLAISDIALKQPLPPTVASDVQADLGCIAGAIQIADYERLLRDAGFDEVIVTETGADLNVYSQVSSWVLLIHFQCWRHNDQFRRRIATIARRSGTGNAAV
jgi:arsenite methyltransferase